MQRKNIIVTTSPTVETWGNFKKLCEAKNLPYHTLSRKKFPITFSEYVIHRTEFK